MLASVLALGGEFAFVVFSEADRAGLINRTQRDQFTAIVGLSIALTPLVLLAIDTVLKRRRKPVEKLRDFDDIPDAQPQVMIAGFGRFGQIVARQQQARIASRCLWSRCPVARPPCASSGCCADATPRPRCWRAPTIASTLGN